MAKRRSSRATHLFGKFTAPLLRNRETVPVATALVERQENEHDQRSVENQVSWPLRIGAAWSWRMLVVVAGLVVVAYGLSYVTVIVIPVALAVLLAVLLDPINRFFRKKLGLPSSASAAISLILGLGIVVGLISLSSSQILSQLGDLVKRASDGLQSLSEWLQSGPLGLELNAVDGYLSSLSDEVLKVVQNNSGRLASGALSITSTVGNVITGALICLFVLFFLMKDGRKIWMWVLRCLPERSRQPLHEAGIRGWVTLSAYAKAQITVAAIDALGIGLGAFFLGVPLAIPLGVLVFLGSFIPIVGAFVTGSIAVLVALVDQGFTTALFMLLVILIVQQVEGNVLQPWLMSNAVSLHPVAVLLAVAAGSFLFGIPGALFAVPVAAFLNTSILYLYGYDKFPKLADDPDRPGGPPGTLVQQIADTYGPEVRRVDSLESIVEGDDSESDEDDSPEEGEADNAEAPAKDAASKVDEEAGGDQHESETK